MLQYLRCSALCRTGIPLRPRSTRKTMSGGRPLGSSFSSTATASSRGRGGGGGGGGGRVHFSARRGPLPSTLAAASAAAVGGVALIACIAAAESSRPGSSVLAAASTRAAVPAVVEKEQEEEGENATLVAAAHELRRSLTPPHQSLFRVVCILVYEDSAGKLHQITGTNAESSTIGGSICAERAAMCKLREASDCRRVTKVVVVTDNPGPLAPGVLCREFLSAHLPPSTPVIMAGAGSGCDTPGGLLYDEELDQKPPPEVAVPSGPSSTCDRRAAAAAGAEGGSSKAPPSPMTATTTTTTPTSVQQPSPGHDTPGSLTVTACSSSSSSSSSEGDPEVEGGVADEEPKGGHMDVCTVGDLYPWRNMYGITGRQELLRLGFLRQQVAEELAKPGLAEALGLDSGVVEAHDAAWRATAEDKRDGVHPIRYAAVCLFPDGEAEIAHQVKALEYGATLDPVTLLAPAMLRRAKDGVRPSWIIVCDQFGLMHAPFAQARTFLSEHGFEETKVALHAEDGAVVVVKAKDLVPRVITSR